MKIIELYEMDYNVSVINAMQQNWKKTGRFNCIGRPKRCNMLIYLDGCSAVYTLPDGERIFAQNGSIVYLPKGAEYSVEFKSENGSDSVTNHINFVLYSELGEPFTLNDKLCVYTPDNANYKLIFNKISKISEANIRCSGKMKSILYDLLYKISSFYKTGERSKFEIISKGIEYFEQEDSGNIAIGDIAKLCNVSEVYFRKLFKEYAGVSPTEYRTAIKINKAKEYLASEELDISEISYRLGFAHPSYFIKLFKTLTGSTPYKYRQNINKDIK